MVKNRHVAEKTYFRHHLLFSSFRPSKKSTGYKNSPLKIIPSGPDKTRESFECLKECWGL